MSEADQHARNEKAQRERALLALAEILVPQRLARERAWLESVKADPWWLPYQVHHPEGESGPVRLVRRETTEVDALLRNLERSNELRGFRAYPGTWTYLVLEDKVWMSDTPEEIGDHLPFIRRAEGAVLVTGLGLGVVVQALLRKPSVRRVDIVERDPHVARLVAPTFQKDPRFHLHVADAWEWWPPRGGRYDWCWHDIWPELAPANIPEFMRIRRRYRTVARRQWCWAEEYVRRLADILHRLQQEGMTPEARARAREAMHALNERRHHAHLTP